MTPYNSGINYFLNKAHAELSTMTAGRIVIFRYAFLNSYQDNVQPVQPKMALVSYSDSEASDSEQETKVTQQSNRSQAPTPANPPKPSSGANFVIRVALPEIKPENPTADGEGEPARKRVKTGGGGAFSGFNALLPPPKRTNVTAEKDRKTAAPARKVFSLKTGAAPGFDREADEEFRREQAFDSLAGDGDDETIPKPGSLRSGQPGDNNAATAQVDGEKKEELKLKGNPMMFKPLSVGRASQKKKKQPAKAASSSSLTTANETTALQSSHTSNEQPAQPALPAPQKPKISLFSLSTEETTTSKMPEPQAQAATYEPLVYTTDLEATPAGPEPEPEPATAPSQPPTDQTLDNIADDLNLSRAQRRQLFGRNADPSKSRILHFNTDKEYIANQELAHQTDLAAAQHNPVRAIAPGKHTLQQLVNAASTQREALEESFAAGRRNKKEAGSKYGW
ncbi:PRCC domain-containing protein [Aspergillus novofumigatus IBT 16806]|uniref:Mitotic checkpoint regulator, MAD2B-interacting-domain-containing protein n=1 Tax=Aspergillus novofumigatus (strain IBT 16806) TaxID=1392255 RepID=A0A2I1CN17_ASPN1|nr:uncharacterized protein P174DRAFT_437455 [Aspergillus novofumigatus IBT 16806]PKX99018.1 hypothetical protein P174DRAFT_437455 [Aspergillus novofumigatus IBT 16806]